MSEQGPGQVPPVEITITAEEIAANRAKRAPLEVTIEDLQLPIKPSPNGITKTPLAPGRGAPYTGVTEDLGSKKPGSTVFEYVSNTNNIMAIFLDVDHGLALAPEGDYTLVRLPNGNIFRVHKPYDEIVREPSLIPLEIQQAAAAAIKQ